ncbi:hypothetical protein FHX42_001495 [Saccharopolyspora lacisalsi]|uniref:Uncharacterized protein n=1 Tax=Halosaccharopolyspora lacisalsi TaxID=1000566 RepID=A0A839DV83_9PSEU|nr:hypothetical protein [Halosaccharopolyspora lacisalsi]MBA8824166.1 hypothetical protein [Halosaccharopolyspora lacisalsi]
MTDLDAVVLAAYHRDIGLHVDDAMFGEGRDTALVNVVCAGVPVDVAAVGTVVSVTADYRAAAEENLTRVLPCEDRPGEATFYAFMNSGERVIAMRIRPSGAVGCGVHR